MSRTTASGCLAVEAMDHGELKDRLLYLHRAGRLVPYPHKLVMGHAKRLKAGCPTANDLSTVRRLIADARYDDEDSSVVLIDDDDGGEASREKAEKATNYEEF